MEKHGGDITKAEFERMRKLYRDNHPKGTQAVLFSRDTVEKVINTPGAEGMRVYLGETEKGEVTTMLVPTDAKGQNIFESIQDRGQLCPPYCP